MNEPPKVLCVTANPCIDKIMWYRESLEHPTAILHQLGGKGVNVARMLGGLGYRAVSLTFGGDRERSLADKEPCRTVLISVCQPIREIPLIVDCTTNKAHLQYADTNYVSRSEANMFLNAFCEELKKQPDLVIISGGACTGTEGLFPVMVHLAKAAGLIVILDSYGPCFLSSLSEKPDYVKPNREELELVVGSIPFGEECAAARKLITQGAGNVLLTMGEQGVFCITEEGTVFYPSFQVSTVSTVGCGDSFTAYFAHGLLQGWPLERCLEVASAAGAVSATQAASGHVLVYQVNRLLGQRRLPTIERADGPTL